MGARRFGAGMFLVAAVVFVVAGAVGLVGQSGFGAAVFGVLGAAFSFSR